MNQQTYDNSNKVYKCTPAHRGRMAGAKRRMVDLNQKCYPLPNLPATEYPEREAEWILQYRVGYYAVESDEVYPMQYDINPPKPQQYITDNFIQPSRNEAIQKYQNTRDRTLGNSRTQVSIRIDPAIAQAARDARINVSRVCEDALAQMIQTITAVA